MKNNLLGFMISALLHVGLMLLMINLGNSQPAKPPESASIPLTLAMFEPEPEPIPKPVMPVEPEPKVEPIIEPEQVKKIEPKPEPKKKKVVKKKVKKKLKKRKKKERRKDPEMERLIRTVMNPPKQTRPQPVVKPRPRQPVSRLVRHEKPRQKTTYPVQHLVSRRIAPQRARPAVNHPQTSKAEAAYRARLNQLLRANKRYPKRAKRMGKQGTVKVSFIILRNGSIQNIRLVNSSGNSTLDSAALRAVKSISGKLPFPKEIKKSQWLFTVPVIYQLR